MVSMPLQDSKDCSLQSSVPFCTAMTIRKTSYIATISYMSTDQDEVSHQVNEVSYEPTTHLSENGSYQAVVRQQEKGLSL